MSSASTTKSFSECSVEELTERLKKHEFCIKLIKQEMKKKGVTYEASTSTTKQTQPKKPRGEIQATKDEMKKVLSDKGVDFKSSSSKDDLIALIRKNNLVRIAEEEHNSKKEAKQKKKS